MFCKV
jgi:hypothetical protein